MDTEELARATWRTASYTQANGSCVEVAGLSGGRVAVRDTKDRGGPALVVTADVWRTLLADTLASDLA
jgi:sirohydrochlorin ferrochelatase